MDDIEIRRIASHCCCMEYRIIWVPHLL